MRTLIMWNMVTLEGNFEGAKSWDLSFHDVGWGEELEQFSIDQLKAADLLLFGRLTYEGMAKYWPSAKGRVADLMNGIPKIVFSRTLKSADWTNTLVRADARGAREKDVLGCESRVVVDSWGFTAPTPSRSTRRPFWPRRST